MSAWLAAGAQADVDLSVLVYEEDAEFGDWARVAEQHLSRRSRQAIAELRAWTPAQR